MPTFAPVTATIGLPVDVASARAQAGLDLTGDASTDAAVDARLTRLISSSTAMAEAELGRPILTRTFEAPFERFPDGDELRLGTSGVTEITWIRYTPADGGAQIDLPTTVYELDARAEPQVVALQPGQSWPTAQVRRNAVIVRFVAGWTDAAAVPEGVKNWILMYVADNFRNAESYVEREVHALPYLSALLDPHRVVSFA